MFIEDFPRWLESELPGVGAMLGERLVQCLMYADDIVLVATCASDLQLMLDKLDEYCNRWRLCVNVKKTEVMIFQSHACKQPRTGFTFTFNGRPLSVVDSFKYLGIVFKWDGSLDMAMDRVVASARKAFFMFTRRCSSFMLGPSMCSNLYQTFIFSILSYGAELWGVACKTRFTKLEQLQLLVGRSILGVPVKTSSAGVLGELGWKSVRCRALMRAVSYWKHICRLPDSRLVSAAAKVNCELAMRGKNCFLRSLNRALNEMTCPLFELDLHADNRLWAGKATRGLLEYDFRVWRGELDRIEGRRSGLNKLRTYRLFKHSFCLEPHLSWSMPEAERRVLTRFRLGVAPLRIETGRMERRAGGCLAACDRLCQICCSGAVEDEMHVLTTCRAYFDLRVTMNSVAAIEFPSFRMASMEQRFVLLMANESEAVTRAVARFVYLMIERRSLLLPLSGQGPVSVLHLARVMSA
jgi:hypothetical protein